MTAVGQPSLPLLAESLTPFEFPRIGPDHEAMVEVIQQRGQRDTGRGVEQRLPTPAHWSDVERFDHRANEEMRQHKRQHVVEENTRYRYTCRLRNRGLSTDSVVSKNAAMFVRTIKPMSPTMKVCTKRIVMIVG